MEMTRKYNSMRPAAGRLSPRELQGLATHGGRASHERHCELVKHQFKKPSDPSISHSTETTAAVHRSPYSLCRLGGANTTEKLTRLMP